MSSSYWACVISYLPMLKEERVTVWTGDVDSHVQFRLPIWKVPPSTATMSRPGMMYSAVAMAESIQPDLKAMAFRVFVDVTEIGVE